MYYDEYIGIWIDTEDDTKTSDNKVGDFVQEATIETTLQLEYYKGENDQMKLKGNHYVAVNIFLIPLV